MTTLNPTSGSFNARGGFGAFVQTLFDEAGVLLAALLWPGKVIGEVQQIHKLQREAERVEAADPARAAALRRQAARTGLR